LLLAHGPGGTVYWRIGGVTIFGLFLFFIGFQIETNPVRRNLPLNLMERKIMNGSSRNRHQNTPHDAVVS
jgi:hypothetical protein